MVQWQGRAVDVRAVGRLVVRGTRRAALTLIGFALVALGLAGLLLPILPGWLLILAGFALLSREYSWAHSGLTFARRHAARGGQKLRSYATARRRRGAAGGGGPSAEVVIDLTTAADDSEEPKFAGGAN
ncbi:MAG TPA: PGPGW domain-containing protein [Acidimicrobiia bacterium]|nr:PGPGW domain-containing protein [Acidimicrobiia bacterium]